jgi:hypothetical protein
MVVQQVVDFLLADRPDVAVSAELLEFAAIVVLRNSGHSGYKHDCYQDSALHNRDNA